MGGWGLNPSAALQDENVEQSKVQILARNWRGLATTNLHSVQHPNSQIGTWEPMTSDQLVSVSLVWQLGPNEKGPHVV